MLTTSPLGSQAIPAAGSTGRTKQDKFSTQGCATGRLRIDSREHITEERRRVAQASIGSGRFRIPLALLDSIMVCRRFEIGCVDAVIVNQNEAEFLIRNGG